MPVAPPSYRQTRSLRAPGARRRGGKPYEYLQKKEELDDDDAEYIPGGSGKQTGLCSQVCCHDLFYLATIIDKSTAASSLQSMKKMS